MATKKALDRLAFLVAQTAISEKCHVVPFPEESDRLLFQPIIDGRGPVLPDVASFAKKVLINFRGDGRAAKVNVVSYKSPGEEPFGESSAVRNTAFFLEVRP
jgi:hypothetical protein